MNTDVRDLSGFIDAVIELIEFIQRHQDILFDSSFRHYFQGAARELLEGNPELENRYSLRMLHNDIPRLIEQNIEELHRAGLAPGSAQLDFKLSALSNSLEHLEEFGGKSNLMDVIDKESLILGSLFGAIPLVGSAAKELLDLAIDQLKKKGWKRLK